ncbi:MAG: hypothetical protein MUF79_13545 [Burkholderiales bacterium]|jgi:hypothetical protein|nr:hypothetical protein [Burkholderiales bacterium]
MLRKHVVTLSIAVLASFAGSFALAADDGLSPVPTPSAKVDNGLGELAVASTLREVWLYSQPAERQDNGLGALPNVADMREPWLFSQPAPKVDSGLGEIAVPRAVHTALGAAPR